MEKIEVMRSKTVFVLMIGGLIGFMGGLAFCLKKILESNNLRNALKHIIADKIDKVLYSNEPRTRNHSFYYEYKTQQR